MASRIYNSRIVRNTYGYVSGGISTRLSKDYPKYLKRILRRIIVDENGCWIWPGPTEGTNGYGVINLYSRKKVKIHRFIAYCFHGLKLFDDTLDACHSCDVRNCVNPFHIWVGTRSDNFNDAVNKGRWHGGSYAMGNYYNDLKKT